MKKFFVFLAAFFAMAFYCTKPILVKAFTIDDDFYYEKLEPELESPYDSFVDSEFHDFYETNNTTNQYFFSFHSVGNAGRDRIGCYTYQVNLGNMDNVTFTQNDRVVTLQGTFNIFFKGWEYNTSHTVTGSQLSSTITGVTMIILDLDNCTFTMYKGLNVYTINSYTPHYLYDFYTNMGFEAPLSLNLSISFDPATNGTISRSQTISGKQYTSDYLDMIMSNHGDDAQFAWFIVPHGGSISFPSSISSTNQGFSGSPVFAYVTDEWIQLENKVYSPCVWHTIPKNYINQYYSVPWGSMKLYQNTQYDCVVYAKIISHTENISSPTWSTSAYTVQSDLSDIVEVYRSTFSISDPAEYKQKCSKWEKIYFQCEK